MSEVEVEDETHGGGGGRKGLMSQSWTPERVELPGSMGEMVPV